MEPAEPEPLIAPNIEADPMELNDDDVRQADQV